MNSDQSCTLPKILKFLKFKIFIFPPNWVFNRGKLCILVSLFEAHNTPYLRASLTSPMAAARSRGWIWTLNNPEGHIDMEAIAGLAYGVYQLEVGANGTPHYQGYFEFTSRKSFAQLRQMLPRAHLEQRRGSPVEARRYCTKEDTRRDGPWEFGDPPAGAGARKDIDELRQLVHSGASEKDVADSHTGMYLRYTNGIRNYMRLVQKSSALRDVYVAVYYGDSGAGKTYKASQDNPEAYWKMPDNKWFDGYNGESTVIIDDFGSGDSVPFSYRMLLRLLDRYPLMVEVKGSSVNFVATKIIMTSNFHPRAWYPQDTQREEDWKQLNRRIHSIIRFEDGKEPVEEKPETARVQEPDIIEDSDLPILDDLANLVDLTTE